MGGARCPDSAPICRFDGGKGKCFPEGEIGFGCTKQSDCGGGMRCCAVAEVAGGPIEWSECRRACGTALLENVCEKDADCPAMLQTGANGGMKRARCVARAASLAMPPWMKQCALP
jgi:hypothetical protein